MGTVYLARRSGMHGFQRLVAIKRLHPHLRDDPDLVRMFIDEARLAARIHHPNVVPIVEVGDDASGLYVVMDYIEGGSASDLALAASSAKTPLSRPVALRIALDALAGLHAAHSLLDDDGQRLEIVHRDVSPQNILVGVDGLARLTDFGIARAASRLHETKRNEIKGKLGYMAPEQALGHPLDARVDVFAMGVVLWELVAGRLLFRSESDAESINNLLYRRVPRLAQVSPSVPPELDEICARALSRNPDDRFSTALAFLDALERAGRGLGEIASHREVGVAVEALVGTQVRSVRESLREFLPARPASSPEIAEKSGSPATDARASTVRAVMTDDARVSTARNSRVRASVVGGVLLIVVLIAGVELLRTRSPKGAAAAPSGAAPTVLEETPMAIDVPDPAPPARAAQTGVAASSDPTASRKKSAPAPRTTTSAGPSARPATSAPLNGNFGERL
jgi:eukaryotic-like serine/threonine-protein kinase